MLRVAYIGFDLFWPCLDMLLRRPDVALTCVVTANAPRSRRVRQLAQQHGIPLRFGPLTPAIIAGLANDNALVVVASYPRMIPLPPPGGAALLNIHPALLPGGRGPNPIPWLLLEAPELAGVTIHHLTASFDAGPIVGAAPIDLDKARDFYTYAAQAGQVSAVLLNDVVDRLAVGAPLPSAAQEEGAARFWPMPRRPDLELARTNVAELQRMIAAYGPAGVGVVGHDGAAFTIHGLVVAAGLSAVPGAIVRSAICLELGCADGTILVRAGWYEARDTGPKRPLWRRAAARLVRAGRALASD